MVCASSSLQSVQNSVCHEKIFKGFAHIYILLLKMLSGRKEGDCVSVNNCSWVHSSLLGVACKQGKNISWTCFLFLGLSCRTFSSSSPSWLAHLRQYFSSGPSELVAYAGFWNTRCSPSLQSWQAILQVADLSCYPHPVQHALRWRMLGGNTFCSLSAVY